MDEEMRTCVICGELYKPSEVLEDYGKNYDGYCQNCIYSCEDWLFMENERGCCSLEEE